MRTKLKLLVTLLAFGISHAFAQSVPAPKTTVQTTTSEQGGKTVTEHTITTTSVVREVTERPTGFTAAVFTSNRAGAEYNGQLPVLEDLLTGKLTDLGFKLMSREFVTTAASKFDGAQVEDPLADQSTAVRLAQSMGADYILSASITSLSKQKRNISAYGVQLANYTYTLRLTYKVLDASGGGSLTGGVVTATKTEQNTVNANSGFNVVPPDPSTPPAPAGSPAANADEALMRYAKQYEKAVGVVAVQLPDGQLIAQATAWGVGPHAFATNSHVTEGVVKKYAAKGYQTVVVINKHPDLVYRVTKAITHPSYGSANNAAGSYDVGILEVDGTLSSWFPVAAAAELKQMDSGYRVAYLGFPQEENVTAVDPRSPVATFQSGIVTSKTDWMGGVGTPEGNFLVQHNLSSSGGASGSPIFNSKGQVIALLNSGNIVGGVVVKQGKDLEVKTRIKSGLQIGYAQRADLLAEIYNGGGGGSRTAAGDSGSSVAATPKFAAVTFVDPDMEPILADLLDDATTQIASALRGKVANNRIAAAAPKAGPVTITVKTETADLYIPDVRLSGDNTVSIQDGKLAVAPLNVSVEVDGVTVGSAPGKISLRPGLSKIRLTREGYLPWERTINAVEGQTLTIAMQMSPDGLKRWAELTTFMNNLKNGAKLTDAQVKVLEGQAKMLGNSGFKVNTTQGVTVKVGQGLRSLFDW